MWGAFGIGLVASALASAAAAQSWPAPVIPAMPPRAATPGLPAFAIPPRPASDPIVVHVASDGSDAGEGSATRPYATLARAQAAVLRFAAGDGGQNGHVVRWEGAPGAYRVISGGIAITGWRLADRARGIWSAAIPLGTESRQLTVNGRLAQRASVKASRTALRFTTGGKRSSIPRGGSSPTCPIGTAWRWRERAGSPTGTPPSMAARDVMTHSGVEPFPNRP